MIEIRNLYKAFGDKEVLKNITATFENGKTNLIIGQSGSGKTVLMKNLVGLLDPTSGNVLYDGRDFVAMSKHEKILLRREMGMIFQYLFCDEPNSGLDPKTSLVIDELLHSITHEYDITTIINTHDMNSVMGIGESIIFIHQGNLEWRGESKDIMMSDNKLLTDFIFASDLLKQMRQSIINK